MEECNLLPFSRGIQSLFFFPFQKKVLKLHCVLFTNITQANRVISEPLGTMAWKDCTQKSTGLLCMNWENNPIQKKDKT